eukprot:tig00020681_g12839.t1
MRENGVDCRQFGVEPHLYPGMGVGLRATRPFAKDDLLVTVPLKFLLLGRSFIQIPQLPTKTTFMEATAGAALRLLQEDANPQSFWRPYLDLLPRSFTTLDFFGDQDIELLACPLRKAAARKSRDASLRTAAEMYERARPELEALPPSHRTLGAFQWAMQAAMTREFGVDPAEGFNPVQLALVPLADMANHAPRNSHKYAFDHEKEHFFIRAGCEVAAGDQIFIEYSPLLCNWRLQKRYGFIIPNNPLDLVKVKASDVLAVVGPALRAKEIGEEEWKRREALLREKGFWRGMAIEADGAPNPILKRAVCVASLRRKAEGSDEEWAARLQAVLDGKFSQGVTPDDAKRSAALLTQVFKRAQARLAGSEAEDDRLLRDDSLRPTARAAVEWRREQRRLVQRIFVQRQRKAPPTAASN